MNKWGLQGYTLIFLSQPKDIIIFIVFYFVYSDWLAWANLSPPFITPTPHKIFWNIKYILLDLPPSGRHFICWKATYMTILFLCLNLQCSLLRLAWTFFRVAANSVISDLSISLSAQHYRIYVNRIPCFQGFSLSITSTFP